MHFRRQSPLMHASTPDLPCVLPEKEPVTARTYDAPGCPHGSGADCLARFIAAATAAVAEQEAGLVWCEFCAADGVEGRSVLSATVDWRVMDCRGLSPAESGCCQSANGVCGAHESSLTPHRRQPAEFF